MIDLIYIADAYCGWCYGFSPTAQELNQNPEVNLQLMHGSLFTGEHAQPLSAFPRISAANTRITELTGAEFGPGYQTALADGSLVMDSTDAAKGFHAIQKIAGDDRALEALSKMQKAFYLDGMSLSSDATYVHIAGQMGLDANELLQALHSPAITELARAEQFAARQIGQQFGSVHYPGIYVDSEDGMAKIGSPTASVEQILAQAKAALPPLAAYRAS